MNILKISIRFFIFFSLSFYTLFAEKVEITSDAMQAENVKKKVYFTGNVMIRQAKNWLHGDKVVVYFDENNETNKYEAIGNVTFEFKKEKSFYSGHANEVTYLPTKAEYILKGKAVIDDKINKRHVNGNEIIFNMLTGDAKVKGSAKKPVKFIFDMENSK